MSSTSNTGHSKSYDFDFSKSFAVQWGETQVSEDLRLDAYEIQDQRIADWLNQKIPPLYADAIDIAAAAHCAAAAASLSAVLGYEKEGAA